MKTQLLAFKKVSRDKFIFEDFTPKDHILGIIKQGCLIFDDGNGETEIRASECILFQKGVRYLRRVTEPLEMFLFRFSVDTDIFSCSKLVLSHPDWLSDIIVLLDALYEGMYSEDAFCQQALLDSILSLHFMASDPKTQKPFTDDPVVDRFLRIVHADVQRKLNLSAIAENLGLSYIQFHRRFSSVVGKTPAQYIIEHRLSIARKHLLSTEQSIKSIALACGYQDAYYFSNAFKKHYGLSPSAFRRQLSAETDDFL